MSPDAHTIAELDHIHSSKLIEGAQCQIATYLIRLQQMRVIARERSLDADERTRNLKYSLQDPLFRFWLLIGLAFDPLNRRPKADPTSCAPSSRTHSQICRYAGVNV